MTARQANPERLYFRIYLTFIEANKEQLININRLSYYRLAVYQAQVLLGDMMEGASPAILADKIFLTKALINFSQAVKDKEVIIKMTEYYQSEILVGVGMFNTQSIKKKFLTENQRFFSLQTAIIQTSNGPMKLIFSIFVEADKHQLDQYIKRFKENQRNVLRSKAKINNYKIQLKYKFRERQPSRSRSRDMPRIGKDLSDIKEAKDLSDIKEEKDLSDIKEAKEDSRLQLENQQSQIKINFVNRDKQKRQNPQGPVPPGTYLEIQSAAKFHTKKCDKSFQKPSRPLNDAEEKEFQAYSSIIDEYRNNIHLASVFQNGSASLISDGSEQSEMRHNEQKQTYSDKAINKFKTNVATCFNLTMILLAILLIYLMIAPSTRFQKLEKKVKSGSKASKGSSKVSKGSSKASNEQM